MKQLRPADAAVEDKVLLIEATYLNIPTPRVHIAVALLVMTMQQLSGINMMIFYAVAIFADAHIEISSNALASLLAALQVGNTASPFVLLSYTLKTHNTPMAHGHSELYRSLASFAENGLQQKASLNGIFRNGDGSLPSYVVKLCFRSDIAVSV